MDPNHAESYNNIGVLELRKALHWDERGLVGVSASLQVLQHAADVKLQIYAVYACSSSAQGNVEQAQAGAAVPSSAYPRKDPQVPLFNARCSVFPRRTETQRATEPFVADRHIRHGDALGSTPVRAGFQRRASGSFAHLVLWWLL